MPFSSSPASPDARFTITPAITPTIAAVMAVSGAVNFSWPWVDSMNGPPGR